jgi:hypothetical protein
LAKPQKDGYSLRHGLEAAERASRKPIEKLHRKCPGGLEYVWHWFIELSNSRTPGSPISYRDIADWQSMTGIETMPWEVEMIKAMDLAFMSQKD